MMTYCIGYYITDIIYCSTGKDSGSSGLNSKVTSLVLGNGTSQQFIHPVLMLFTVFKVNYHFGICRILVINSGAPNPEETKRCCNVGQASQTLDQHYSKNGSTSLVCWETCRPIFISVYIDKVYCGHIF